MADPWQRVDVSAWEVRSVEQAGSSRTAWLGEPGTDQIWLHKDTVIPENGEEQGEDWSEIVSTQIALSLNIPVAETRLCLRDGRRGSLSLSVVPEGHSLWEGWVMLEDAQVPGYFRHSEKEPGVDPARPNVKRPGHSLENIRQALLDVAPPRGFSGPPTMNGFDVFAGYMILDALIANRDRHEQNWAVVMPSLTGDPVRLAPSYDHAGGLGYNLLDRKRESCIRNPNEFDAWIRRGTAHRFEHESTPETLVAHAAAAVGYCTPDGAQWWQEQLRACSLDPIFEALDSAAIPEMSEASSRFIQNLLDSNLGRLRDAIG